MKKILFLTGTRADFGKLKKLMRFVEGRADMELHVAVTGMHMLKLYGATYLEVRREQFEHVYLFSNQYAGEPMSSVLGNTVSMLSRLVDEVQPDLIVVHGDRIEALAGATVGALTGILVCHIEGGELSGTVDDLIRHSVTKLSHLHMVANEEARTRLIQMGEDAHHIYIIGSPDLDAMSAADLPSLCDAKARYNVGFDAYALAIFHPVTTERSHIQDYARWFFEALSRSGDRYIVIYPNNDLGSQEILDTLHGYRNCDRFRIFPSIRFEYFLTFLKHALYIVGNSSAGVREAPFYGVPAVNVGTRQHRRSRIGAIVSTDYRIEAILEGIDKVKHLKRCAPSAWFGDGDSVRKFKQAITTDSFWRTPVQKSFVDFAKPLAAPAYHANLMHQTMLQDSA
ncbi:UDP-N-acetylglucosamine 2-epimerase [Allopusillimonas ginsengisoli]|uniref:UDP-N-acetylglucosamine 2-epimerase n=1 Tax=Allopusillimonas ginsengisoli TaxID=453575 RepID=UPI00102068BC|nr:UDP-N-acetylglucosamine 2-epimerase [Allopusillimonas ginsengisoli]TEA78019.1 UDP-N-acetylglucosamine 2-epimerase (hydrolyzing) [Allopusillimonas ginsengisoli]